MTKENRDALGSDGAEGGSRRDLPGEGVILTDPGFRVTDFSKGAERIYGVTRDEMVGRRLDLEFQAAFPDGNETEFRGHLANRREGQARLRIRRKDGASVTLETVAVPLWDGPLFTGWMWTSNDGSGPAAAAAPQGQPRAEPHHDGFTRLVTDGLPLGLTVVDVEGRFEYVNPAYARLLERTPDQIIGRFPLEFTAESARAALFDARAERVSGQQSAYESQLVSSDGALVDVLITAAPRMVNGAVTGAVAVVTDIRPLKDAERQLRQALDQNVQRVGELQAALDEARTPSGSWPMCTGCKKVGAADGSWTHVETFIAERTNARLSQGLCPDCLKAHYKRHLSEPDGR